MLKERDVAPEFTLQDQDGREVSLSEFRGRKVVLYFYPKDDTPGCTTQACELRDHVGEFDSRGAVILGVSPDSPADHRRFREKYHLPFTLLADTDHKVAGQYGVWTEKSMFGKKFWGNERTTFVIDEEGRIEKVLPKVRPAEHVGQLLDVIRA